MDDVRILFLEECVASGPLRFERDDDGTGRPIVYEIEGPSVIIGRAADADIVLDEPGVEMRHAYLQLVEGRVFATALEGSEGLRWGEVPRAAGWLERGQSLRIGGAVIRLVGGDQGGETLVAGPAPTSPRYISRQSLPGVVLEIRGEGEPTRRRVMDRVLVLVGSSERCAVKVDVPGISRFAFGLVRTPAGIWMVDLLSTQGVTVNGVRCRRARLEDGDLIRAGPRIFRVVYDGTSAPSGARVETAPVPVKPVTRVFNPGPPKASFSPQVGAEDDLSPEVVLRPFLEQAGADLGSSSPFGEALVMMVRLLGDLHRDQMALVREELAHIRRLTNEMEALRAQPPRPEPPKVNPSLPPSLPRQPEVTPLPEDLPRMAPETVRVVVGERLEEWERERQSRWRKVLSLLTKS